MTSIKCSLVRNILCTGTVLSMCLSLSGCASETLFQSSFNASAVGDPPAHNQATGTATVNGAVSIVQPGDSKEHWVRISRIADNVDPIGSFYGHFSHVGADGHYGLLLAMKVGSDIVGNDPGNITAGAASVEIRPNPTDKPYLLHLDFLPKQPAGQMIRINDDAANTFGTFAADQTFTLSVGIDVRSGTATASVTLLGAGIGSGSSKQNITLPNPPQAGPLGAIQLWMGAPWGGHFDATDIIVTFKPCRAKSPNAIPPCAVASPTAGVP
jgi:hypothetical protein